VACSNCERPICPECMTSTPVGMRCPECASQRTKVRSGPAALASADAPIATYVLIALNVIGFLIEIAAGTGGVTGGGQVIDDFGVRAGAVADGEWYRIVTSGFLHAGLIHLAFNMFALYILGTLLEPAIGTPRFVALYVASLLAGSLGVILLEPDTTAVGASGAIFGLFTAAFVVARGRGLQEVASQLGILLLINFAFTFGVPHIAIGAHLFGAAGGALAALVIVAGERGALGRHRITAEVLTMLGIAIFSAVGAVVLA
jgi:membrane associated rhomboid family serine protease